MDNWFDADAAANSAYWSGQADRYRQQEAAEKRMLALRDHDVEVVRGRKIALGTVGRVFWVGEGQWGWRVGMTTAAGETLWTAIANVRKMEEAA